jgi:hypothetical protein
MARDTPCYGGYIYVSLQVKWCRNQRRSRCGAAGGVGMCLSHQTNTVSAWAMASGSFGGGCQADAVLRLVEWCSAVFNVREICVRNSSEVSSG